MTGDLYIVRISISAEDLRERLRGIEDARLIRELPPGRVVVALPSRAALPRLLALDGVDTATPDRLEHPDHPSPPCAPPSGR
jgi:hypothetical protein